MRSSDDPLRVLLADDHTLVRAGIRALLEKPERGVNQADEAPHGEAAPAARPCAFLLAYVVWLELALFAGRRFNDRSKYPSFEDLMGERDRMLLRNPKTTFVLAHLGWHANDLARLGKLFDQLPNLYAEVGAVLYDLGRQPFTGHDFFVKYQDRVLFGKDAFQPDEYPYFWRVFETRDEYFDYYRDYHAFWKMYGLGLPDDVLKKLYYANALKITPAISKEGFPKS